MNTGLAPGNKKDFDMEDIEKRAEAYAKKEWGEFGMIPKLLAVQAYIAGASEQKHIDDCMRLKNQDDMTQAEYDREAAFFEWFNNNKSGTITFSDAIEWGRKDVLDSICERFRLMNADDELYENFKKAMEE